MRSFIVGALVTLAFLSAVRAGFCEGYEAGSVGRYATFRWVLGYFNLPGDQSQPKDLAAHKGIKTHVECVSLCRARKDECGGVDWANNGELTCHLKPKGRYIEFASPLNREIDGNLFHGLSIEGDCGSDAAKKDLAGGSGIECCDA